MTTWRQALIALGSNSGDRLKNLSEGLAKLLKDNRLELISASGVYETAAQEKAAGGKNFYNATVLVKTSLGPDDLIWLMGKIEHRFGRLSDRKRRDRSRRLDLDLIYLGDLVCNRKTRGLNPLLIVPHPRLRKRNFVLAPANEIAPRFVDPTDGLTVAGLWRALQKEGAKKPERVAELIPRGRDGN